MFKLFFSKLHISFSIYSKQYIWAHSSFTFYHSWKEESEIFQKVFWFVQAQCNSFQDWIPAAHLTYEIVCRVLCRQRGTGSNLWWPIQTQQQAHFINSLSTKNLGKIEHNSEIWYVFINKLKPTWLKMCRWDTGGITVQREIEAQISKSHPFLFPWRNIRRAKDGDYLRLWPSVLLVAMVTFHLLSSSDSALLLWLLCLLAASQSKTPACYCHHRRRKSQGSTCEASVVFF